MDEDQQQQQQQQQIDAITSIIQSGLSRYPWSSATIPAVLEVTFPSPCIRCALRLAGFRDVSIFQAPLRILQASLLSLKEKQQLPNLPSHLSAPTGENGGCRICLGILQGGGGDDAAAVASASSHVLGQEVLSHMAAAIKKKGYQVKGNEGAYLGISLPACITIRDRGCWEWLKDQGIIEKGIAETAVLDVKDVIKAAMEKGVPRDLGLCLDQQHGKLKLLLSYCHVGADKGDYELAVKRLLPGGKGKAFQRTNKRRRNQGSNEDNLCNQSLIHQVMAAADEKPEGIVRWFGEDLIPLEGKATTTIQVNREPLYVHGRYLKFCRDMPQTSWILGDDTKVGKSSVEEVIAEPIKEFCGTDSTVFMGAGREDIDVRMLGNGRPFLLQVNDPRRVPETSAQILALEEAINAKTGLNVDGDVQVSQLCLSDKSKIKEMHDSAEDKEKFYSCLVWVSKPVTRQILATKLECLKDLQILQKTPIRVLHRRSLLNRPRMIYEMRCEMTMTMKEEEGDPRSSPEQQQQQQQQQRDPHHHHFTLHLRSSAGTYIKEFVHGDLGRTVPSVGTLLGCDADLLQLDVTDVLDKGNRKTTTTTTTTTALEEVQAMNGGGGGAASEEGDKMG